MLGSTKAALAVL